MADGDKLTLGELQNSATSMTRLVGRVDDGFAFRVDQEGTGGQAIMAIGTIFGFGSDSSSQPGGTGISGQGGKGVPSQGGGVGVVGNGGGPDDDRGDGVWGLTTSASHTGVFGANFGLGPAVRGYSAEVPPGGQPPVHPTGYVSRARQEAERESMALRAQTLVLASWLNTLEVAVAWQ